MLRATAQLPKGAGVERLHRNGIEHRGGPAGGGEGDDNRALVGHKRKARLRNKIAAVMDCDSTYPPVNLTTPAALPRGGARASGDVAQ